MRVGNYLTTEHAEYTENGCVIDGEAMIRFATKGKACPFSVKDIFYCP